MIKLFSKSLIIFILLVNVILPSSLFAAENKIWWDVQSIDTMKYSRDIAREKLNDSSYDADIDQQVRMIADTGANYIGIGTPYDEEFLPYLKRWVSAARKYNLKVWFRGNWSNWEGWFDRPRQMDFATHIQKSKEFIINNPDLFEDGDSFTACPECENGAAGDPRMTGKVKEYRQFLIDEVVETNKAFKQIRKSVSTNWLSMNYDVAMLIMDRETAHAVGGVISIDHYVKDPQRLANDVTNLHNKTGARILLGEFGAPILDIHGDMTEEEQAEWVRQAFALLAPKKELYGINYWVNLGGSTRIWNDDYSPRLVVRSIGSYYTSKLVTGRVTDQLGRSIDQVLVYHDSRKAMSREGYFELPIIDQNKITFEKEGYYPVEIIIDDINKIADIKVTMIPDHPNFWYKLMSWWQNLWN